MSATFEGLAKYLVAVIKCNDNAEETEKLVEAKLKELINSELDACIEIVKIQETEWGEVAIRVNFITKKIITNIDQLRSQ